MATKGAQNLTTTSTAEAEPKATRRQAAARRQPYARSRVGNGKALIAGIDQRSLPYREYQDTVADLVHHLGNAPTAAEGALVEEVAGLIVWCRSARLALLQGQKFDVAPYCTAVNSLRRLLCDLGLEARAFDVTDEWDNYLARKGSEKKGGPIWRAR